MTMGVSGVLARIQELQTQLGIAPTQTGTVTVNGGDPTGGDGDNFASTLAGVTGGSDDDSDGSQVLQTSGGVSGDDIVSSAKKYLGTPYVFGSTDPSKGLDCSALVQRAYKDMGIKLPRLSYEQADVGTPVASLAEAKPGDIVAFDTPVDHVGIYLGNNKMIAAPKPGDHVKIESVYERPSHIRRIVSGVSTAAAQAAATPRPAALQGNTSLAVRNSGE